MSLARLLEDAGPRVAGSDAETAAFDRVQAALESIRESISRSSGSGSGSGSDSPVAVDILRATHSGQFALRGPGAAVAREQTMVYTNLTSLAIRVRHRDWNPDDPGSNPAAFISAHVDTVHVSPGGFDNAANVAVAVETARAFAHGAADRPEDARAGALIVAFNSAEEDGFMGAHGVATGHPWFPSVGCALNLESMGVGGPHRMFQATRGGASDALLRVWSEAAPRPTGTVVASDIFAAGLIKSDTDHRVFRDDGDAPGFDFAFLERTEAYHTPRDRLARAREGSLQASGDNLLAFARAFAKHPPEGTTRGGVSRAEGVVRRGSRVAAGAKTNANDDARVDAKGIANGNANANMNAGTGPGSPARSKDVGATWFAVPGFSRFVMYDAVDPNVGAAMVVASATTFASIARGAYLRDAASAGDAARTAVAAATATAGAAAAGLVGPVAAAAAAILAAVLAGTPAPWAADKRLFFAIAVPPAIVAPAMVLAATRAALTRLKRPADEPPEVAAARRKKNDDEDQDDDDGDGNANDAGNGRARRRVTSAAYLTPEASADWTLLAATTFVASSLAAWLVRRRVASAYLVVAPAACWTVALLLAPAARVWREFAGARATLGSRTLGLGSVPTPTAIATASLAPAWIAFPTYVEFAELVFGMTARSRAPPTALRGYAHDAVCGAAAGAFAFLLLPMILTLLREPQTKRDGAKNDVPASDRLRSRTRSRSRRNAETHPFATSMGLLCVAWALAIGFSTTNSSPSRGSPWTADRPLPLSVAATSTSTGDFFVVAHPAGPGRSSAFAAAFRAAGLDVTCDDVRVDMASYAATSDAGACVIRDGALAGEMAASVPAPSLAPAPPPRAGLVPVRFHPGGAGRWVIAVDRSCARRVAIVPGDDVENVPVGPWRLVALGGAGTGTGNVRYAAFGAGGGDANATKSADGFVVWVETRERAGDACVGAVTARADHDVEVPAVRRVLDAAPEWVTTFAKHHTPLKAARVVVADAAG